MELIQYLMDAYHFTDSYVGDDIDSGFLVDLQSLCESNRISIDMGKIFSRIHMQYHEKNNSLNVLISFSSRICVKSDDRLESYLQQPDKVELVIFSDNSIYKKYNDIKKGATRLVPFTVKSAVLLFKTEFLKNFFRVVFSFYETKSKFACDVWRCIESDNCFYIPLLFDELCLYHSPSDMFAKKYKTSKNVSVNFNRRNMNVSYFIIKSINKVDAKSKGILEQISVLPEGFCPIYDKQPVISFLHQVIEVRCSAFDVSYLVDDYIRMCNILKKKIDLSATSVKALQRRHDKLSVESYKRRTPKVTIVKNSKFKGLNNLLSEDFEWIKTRKRLIEETAMQNNCVWSYAQLINKDVCQIYSVVYDGVRYTVEFGKRKGKFVLRQVQGPHNGVSTDAVTLYIQSLLRAR